MWAPQIRRYPREGYFLIVPDIRGHGESSPVPEFRIGDCATDVAGLLDELGLDKAVIVGVSMGGVVAQQFAISHPERIGGLVLADTFSGVRGSIARLNARAADLGLSLLPGLWQWKIIESHFDAPAEEAIREYFRTMLFETDPEQLKQARRAINRFDCVDDLDRITVPTLVLVGKENGKWFVDLSRTTADEIDSAQFEILSNGRDPSNLSATDDFDSAALGFLRSIDGADTE
jgi:3-oxoadipate enol-lactonase